MRDPADVDCCRYMYAKLGYGWGNTLLAFIAVAVGVAAPCALWMFGRKLRERRP